MRRGQAHTLEAVAAGTILLASVVFAAQTAAVTPLTASTSSQHIENQERALADSALAAASNQGTLKPTILFVNNSTGGYFWTDFQGQYADGGPPTRFGERMNATFRRGGVAFNLRVFYMTTGGNRRSLPVVYMGVPTDSAVTATQLMTLYDDDVLYEPGGTAGDRRAQATSVTLNDTDSSSDDNIYMSDIDRNGPIYNVIEVEVTVWRM